MIKERTGPVPARMTNIGRQYAGAVPALDNRMVVSRRELEDRTAKAGKVKPKAKAKKRKR